jgi:hypothetical protein
MIKKRYQKAVREALDRTVGIEKKLLTDDDIKHLPAVIQKYIRLSGAVGKEKVINFRAEFNGGIRSNPAEDYMSLRSVQYNFMDIPTRLFYIVAKKKGIPAKGIHIYRGGKAIMLIKLFGIITVADAKGKEMDQGETVTVFNDMCFMAPASLTDSNIIWEEIDSLSVRARFKNGDISIAAVLSFSEKGELVNFISNDRFETTDGKSYITYPWETPVTGYSEINGFHLPSGARLIYKRPEGDFCYGEFNLVSIEYNCQILK